MINHNVTMVNRLNHFNLWDVKVLVDGIPVGGMNDLTAIEAERYQNAVNTAVKSFERAMKRGADDEHNRSCFVSRR